MSDKSKPVIGISSCLLGEKVRYDGGHQLQNSIVKFVMAKNIVVGFCPEVSAQLGTPRPPVELVASDGHIEALGRDDPGLNVTAPLNQIAAVLINKLIAANAIGYIFKARSPSCGVGTTVLLNQQKETLGLTDGLVAAAVLKQLPDLIIVDESAVNSAAACERFNAACQLANAYNNASDIDQVFAHAQAMFPSLKLVGSANDLKWRDILNSHLLPTLKVN